MSKHKHKRKNEVHAIFQNKMYAPLWLLVRLYLAYEWFQAGWHKVVSDAWVGENAGTAVTGFLNGALSKTGGEHPAVQSWYAWFIEHVALPQAELFSYLVAFGEVFVALALLLGAFTGVAALLGATMNFNFLFAGTTSINPQLLLLELFLIAAWRTAGYIGADRWILPKLRKKR